MFNYFTSAYGFNVQWVRESNNTDKKIRRATESKFINSGLLVWRMKEDTAKIGMTSIKNFLVLNYKNLDRIIINVFKDVDLEIYRS